MGKFYEVNVLKEYGVDPCTPKPTEYVPPVEAATPPASVYAPMKPEIAPEHKPDTVVQKPEAMLFDLSTMPPKPQEREIVESHIGQGWIIQIFRDGADYKAEITFASDSSNKRQVKLHSDNLGRIRSESFTFANQNVSALDMQPPEPSDPRYKRIAPTTTQQLDQERDIRRLLNDMETK